MKTTIKDTCEACDDCQRLYGLDAMRRCDHDLARRTAARFRNTIKSAHATWQLRLLDQYALRCVEAHAPLLAAAKALLARIDAMTTEEFCRGGERDERENLRAAVKLAEGGAP